MAAKATSAVGAALAAILSSPTIAVETAPTGAFVSSLFQNILFSRVSGQLFVAEESDRILPMYRADALKERLGWLKVVFGAFLLVDAPLIAWTAQNFWSARPVLLVLAALGIVVATAGIIFTNHRANRAIAELETL